MNQTIEIKIRMDIDAEACADHCVTAEEVAKHLVVGDDDVIDGCFVTTVLYGCNPSADFFLCNAELINVTFVK